MNESDDDLRNVINYTARLASLVAPNALKLSGKTVQFIGWSPFLIEEGLKVLLPSDVKVVIDEPVDRPDFVVIGVEEFDEKLISKAVDMRGDETSFIPQDGFLDLVLFGYNWWTDEIEYLNKSKDSHPGMRYLHSLASSSFRWPSTTAPESDQQGESEGDYQQETELHALGYKTTDLSAAKRWQVLTKKAVPRLGLQEVVGTIASHIRRSKRQKGGAYKYRKAISKWELDLNKLRKEYYKGSRRKQFKWPSTDG
jgi:hypothetical protein